MKCKKKSVFTVYGENYDWECEEEAIEGSNYCVLHENYPEYGSSEYHALNKLKSDKVREKIDNDDFNFISVILDEIEFKNIEVKYLDFMNAELRDVYFTNININKRIIGDNGEPIFESIYPKINFEGAEIRSTVYFSYVTCDILDFSNVKANELIFNNVKFGSGYFRDITVNKYFQFMNMEISRDIRLDNAKLLGDVNVNFSKIKGDISLENVQFKNPIDQEKVFRIAKNIWENQGDRGEADKCFYKEMEAKRKQKKWYFRYLEVVIQYCFGYGVYPGRFIVTWISVILVFTVIYSTQSEINANLGFWSYFYSSVVTAITPGFGTYRPEGNYQLFASVEAILGTFMWAAFIATFTRKYMR